MKINKSTFGVLLVIIGLSCAISDAYAESDIKSSDEFEVAENVVLVLEEKDEATKRYKKRLDKKQVKLDKRLEEMARELGITDFNVGKKSHSIKKRKHKKKGRIARKHKINSKSKK